MRRSFRETDILSRLARELRAPLAAARECINMACLTDGATREWREQYHRATVERLEEIGDIIDVMHDLALVDAAQGVYLDFERTAIEQLVSDVERAVAARAERADVEISCQIPRGIPSALVDTRGVRQVLGHLLANAIKFGGGSPIRVAAVHLAGVSRIRVSVTDGGPGVHPDERECIFDPFVIGRAGLASSGRSTGLGLTMSRAIVHRNGGDIGVEDAPSGGATFWFTIPCLTVEAIDQLVIQPAIDHYEVDPHLGVNVVLLSITQDGARRVSGDWQPLLKDRLRRVDRVITLRDDLAVIVAAAPPRSARAILRRIEDVLLERGIHAGDFFSECVSYPAPGTTHEQFRARVRRLITRSAGEPISV